MFTILAHNSCLLASVSSRTRSQGGPNKLTTCTLPRPSYQYCLVCASPCSPAGYQKHGVPPCHLHQRFPKSSYRTISFVGLEPANLGKHASPYYRRAINDAWARRLHAVPRAPTKAYKTTHAHRLARPIQVMSVFGHNDTLRCTSGTRHTLLLFIKAITETGDQQMPPCTRRRKPHADRNFRPPLPSIHVNGPLQFVPAAVPGQPERARKPAAFGPAFAVELRQVVQHVVVRRHHDGKRKEPIHTEHDLDKGGQHGRGHHFFHGLYDSGVSVL